MRTLAFWIRSIFCAHVWKFEEADLTYTELAYGERGKIKIRMVSATCTRCGWHRSYEKWES